PMCANPMNRASASAMHHSSSTTDSAADYCTRLFPVFRIPPEVLVSFSAQFKGVLFACGSRFVHCRESMATNMV
ncbi:MAG TPA: hypothetical protein PKM68_09020, partial [Bacillota bacterium]|nr:hypothetical protein [Bacillota bacterium]